MAASHNVGSANVDFDIKRLQYLIKHEVFCNEHPG